MARRKDRSSLDCIPSAEAVRVELEQKRKETEALEDLLHVSEEIERRSVAEHSDGQAVLS